MDAAMQQQGEYIRNGPLPPGIADMGQMTCRNPEVSREQSVIQTTDEDFAPDSMIETQFGFAEGYFRRFFETPMIIEWEDGEASVSENGVWKRPKKFAHLPWPLQKDPSVQMPVWFNELLHRMVEVEGYLRHKNSYMRENTDGMCCLCDFNIDYTENFHYVLSLDAYTPPTELRWPAILIHYFTAHRVLPSRLFAMVMLERKL